MSIKVKSLQKKLGPGVSVKRTGFLGMGKKIEFGERGTSLKYTVDRNAFKDEDELAASIRSRMPIVHRR